MIEPNTILQNRYLVLNRIGEGGMGAVYIATDQRFGSTVALKETFFTDSNLRKAFEREARLLNSLRHPALPRVSDHFTEEEGQFIVMEFIPGHDLAEMLKERGAAFPIKDVLGWADQLLDALDYLHTQEPPIIHRDIKPQNLKLMPRGQIILLDFGLAKGTPIHMSRVTATGSVFGYSRHYAPLEQIQGTGTDPRSDIYSLGATLYHLMTGTTPVDALTRAHAVLNNQADPLLPANEVNPEVSTSVAETLQSAMALNSSQRPQSAQEMRANLREAGQQTSAGTRVTNVVAGAALTEQETQLMDAGAGRETNHSSDSAGETAPRAAHHAATLIGPHAGTSGDKVVETNANQDAASVVTKAKREQPHAPSSFLSKQALGAIAGIATFLLLAAVVYSLMRSPAQTSANTNAPLPQTNSNSEAVVPQPVINQNTANQNTESASATPATLPTPAAESPSEATVNKAAPRTTAPPPKPSSDGRAQTNAQANNSPPPVNANVPETPAPPDRRGRSAEDIAARREERRAEQRRIMAERIRRQMERMQRRGQRRRPGY